MEQFLRDFFNDNSVCVGLCDLKRKTTTSMPQQTFVNKAPQPKPQKQHHHHNGRRQHLHKRKNQRTIPARAHPRLRITGKYRRRCCYGNPSHAANYAF